MAGVTFTVPVDGVQIVVITEDYYVISDISNRAIIGVFPDRFEGN